jgi:beta-mannosidase
MKQLPLNGRWQFRQAAKEDDPWQTATVPGCAHTDLLDNQLIPDPYYRDNEHQVSWVGEADWVYRRSFVVESDLLQHAEVVLHCAGLDTLATILLNGTEVGQTNNQFRTWEFAVKQL